MTSGLASAVDDLRVDARAGGWQRYRPATACYLCNAFGLHGLGHAARVLVWANYIGLRLREQGVAVDLETLRWAAALHDVRRLNDGRDPAHGERCGDWLRRGEGLPAGLPQNTEGVAYCCAWHVPADALAPRMTPELLCLKDADALDRVRLGGPDLRLLRTGHARALVGPARYLWVASQVSALNPWCAVREAAQRMGLWELQAGRLAKFRLRYFAL